MIIPQTSALSGNCSHQNPLIKCQVNVKTETGKQLQYAALFVSTCDAAIDALNRFGISKIRVEAIR